MKLSKPKLFTFNKTINNSGIIFTFPEDMGLPNSIVSAVSRIGLTYSSDLSGFIWDDVVVDCIYYPNITNIIRYSFNCGQQEFICQKIDTSGIVISQYHIIGNIVRSNITLNNLGDDILCQIIIKPSYCFLSF